ncbi:MAG: hypothetical protein OXO52_17355 [Rhodospirillales bacterium]|nr:hypothetical protein [Rhodospirillales bacterium]MDE0378495.1 hypothetical protein [Rhodospirillales bacterium]
MKRLLMAALTAGLAAPGTLAMPEARAGDGAGLSDESVVTALQAAGAQVLALGARGGLEGYFVTPARGSGYSLYVTGDGHAVAGLLYAPDGTEVTGIQLVAARGSGASGNWVPEWATDPKPNPAAVAHAMEDGADASILQAAQQARLFERSVAAFGFTLGETGPLTVLFGDAACRWSRAAAAKLGTEALAGRLRLRVVPVGVLGAGAAQGAAAIAASPEPARAWFEGSASAADRQGAARIARNNALLDAWGADAVPLIVWRSGDGTVRSSIGDIDDVPGWLQDSLRLEDTRAGETRAGETRARDPQGGRHPRRSASAWDPLGMEDTRAGAGP